MNTDQFKKTREPLFSIHNHSDGHIALYLEEQDAVKDMLEDVVGNFDYKMLMELQGICAESVKAEGHFDRLETARENLGDGAPLLCSMTEHEALILAEDLIRAVKFARIGREVQGTYPSLKAVK
jgi:hypothetical protein